MKLTIHILEVDTKEDETTGVETETITAKITGGDTTLTGSEFKITETDPSFFGGLVVGHNYDLAITPSLSVAPPAAEAAAAEPASTQE